MKLLRWVRKLYEDIVSDRLPVEIGDKAVKAALKRLKLEDKAALMIAIATPPRDRRRGDGGADPRFDRAATGVDPHGQHKPVSIRGLTPGIAYKLGECCHPVPGDRIVGVRQTGEPIEVHTIDCLASGERAGRGLGGPRVGQQIQGRHGAACR
jgi:GTP pyrophosphokinase